jgi:hypothetical protein
VVHRVHILVVRWGHEFVRLERSAVFVLKSSVNEEPVSPGEPVIGGITRI